MDSSDFIKGEWYKGLNKSAKDWYMCFDDIIENLKVYASECINLEKKYEKGRWYFGDTNDYIWQLVDISEIQRYLPKDHPNKYNIVSKEIDLDYIKALNKLLIKLQNV